MAEYRKACYEFQAAYGDLFDILYMSHGPLTLDYSLIQNMIDTCDDILAGKDDRIEIDFMGERAYLAPGKTEKSEILLTRYTSFKGSGVPEQRSASERDTAFEKNSVSERDSASG